MTYQKTVKILLERGHGNKKNNLSSVKKTAAKLGLNNTGFKSIHIAGTNGKGTTAQLLADTLSNAGFTTGIFTSPHIYCITERIKINNKNISEKDFSKYVNLIIKNEESPLKFFEVLTLAALAYFKDKKVDYAVVEAGIGGRLDSTNIIKPVLSIITSIGLEHTSILGNTLSKIAREKGGIIKKDIPCIAGPLPVGAKKIIKQIAKQKNSKLYFVKNPFIKKIDYKKLTSVFDFQNQSYKLNLIGQAQVTNAALVIKAAGLLGIENKYAVKAFSKINMPCRFEVSKFKNKFIIKDGAHNPGAVKEFLLSYLPSPYYKKDNTLVLAVSFGKDYKKIIKQLKPYFFNVILTSADDASGISPDILAEEFKKPVKIIKNPQKIKLSEISGNPVILGSFYLFCKLQNKSVLK